MSATRRSSGPSVPKQVVSVCFSCAEPFVSEHDKQKCYVCTFIYCPACILRSRVTADYGSVEPVPVCVRCVNNSSAVWMPDEQQDSCCFCRTKFTIFRRRHHCRRCGRLACAKCSKQKQPIPVEFPHPTIVNARVCDECAELPPITERQPHDSDGGNGLNAASSLNVTSSIWTNGSSRQIRPDPWTSAGASETASAGK